ncbi:MAG: hypothetical protein K9N35_01750 [Candidatus Marinimicrobia bacterium]|nr:hypothetical protein [Candidatus Neomarinimicrobiota bacterium]
MIDTFGTFGGSIQDAAIISENDIWLAGRVGFESFDSLGIRTLVWYNAIHWDGFEWTYYEACGNTLLKSVYASSSDDVWFVTGNDIIHYDGNAFTIVYQSTYGKVNQVTKVWGSSGENIYFVGNDGIIVYYDGSTFTSAQPEADSDFIGVAGTPDGEHIFVLSESISDGEGNILLHSRNNLDFWETIKYPLSTALGFDPPLAFCLDVVGDNVYIPKNLELWKYNISSRRSTLNGGIDHIYERYRFIKGLSESDIFYGTTNFDYLHYNGSDYFYANALEDEYRYLLLRGGDFKDNTVVMVGSFESNLWPGKALVARGYRNESH